jgi:hypothetical protein
MPEYIIYRHDRGQADPEVDRGDPNKRPVARVEATSAEEACRIGAQRIRLGTDQHLSAEPAAPVDAHEAELNRTSRALARETLPDITEPAP